MSVGGAIFDLDGVITNTAVIHKKAWKQAFDLFLTEYSRNTGDDFREFDQSDDYLSYVDGRPRYEGVSTFLKSREIALPFGDPGEAPGFDSVCQVGNKKNELFLQELATNTIPVFEDARSLVSELAAHGIPLAVASSSRNASFVIERVGLSDLFLSIVDGNTVAELNLNGKPAPDIFLEAARSIGVAPQDAIVFEDAESGVLGAHRAGFKVVFGIARDAEESSLTEQGATHVASNLEKVTYDTISEWLR